VEAGAFLKTDPALRVADLQLHFTAYCFSGPGVLSDQHGFAVAPTLLHPKSRGEIVLKSSDPFTAPVIRPRYLTEQADMDVLLKGVNIARQIARSGAFDSFGSVEVLPGRDVQERADVERWIRANVDTCFHPTGTCKMGADPAAVVDASLRVHGIEGLRVVDASIMPEIVSGNTNAPTIMIAERAAAMIAGDSSQTSVASV
jgi:choline dehydrogenase